MVLTLNAEASGLAMRPPNCHPGRSCAPSSPARLRLRSVRCDHRHHVLDAGRADLRHTLVFFAVGAFLLDPFLMLASRYGIAEAKRLMRSVRSWVRRWS